MPTGKRCTARTCFNERRHDLILFRFPKNEARSKLWLKNSGRYDLLHLDANRLYVSYGLCAEHFTDDQFINTRRLKLLPTAVPTIFPETLKEGITKILKPTSGVDVNDGEAEREALKTSTATVINPLSNLAESSGTSYGEKCSWSSDAQAPRSPAIVTKDSPPKRRLQQYRKKTKQIKKEMKDSMMDGRTCSYKGCGNSEENSSGMSFYPFPVEDENRLEKWFVNSGCEDLRSLSIEEKRCKFICQKHFSKLCIYTSSEGRFELRSGVLPVPLGVQAETLEHATCSHETRTDRPVKGMAEPSLHVVRKPKMEEDCMDVTSSTPAEMDKVAFVECDGWVQRNAGNSSTVNERQNWDPFIEMAVDEDESFSHKESNVPQVVNPSNVEEYFSLCRLCCSDGGQKHKIVDKNDGILMADLCSKIQTMISPQAFLDDNLPYMVCERCRRQVEQFFAFREKCREAEEKLRRMFSQFIKKEDTCHEQAACGDSDSASASVEVNQTNNNITNVLYDEGICEGESSSDEEDLVEFIAASDGEDTDELDGTHAGQSGSERDGFRDAASCRILPRAERMGEKSDCHQEGAACTSKKRGEYINKSNNCITAEIPKATCKIEKEVEENSRNVLETSKLDMKLLQSFSKQFRDVLLKKKKVQVKVVHSYIRK